MEGKINTVAKMKEILLIARFESLNVKNIHFLRDWAEFDDFYVDLPEEGAGWGPGVIFKEIQTKCIRTTFYMYRYRTL